MFPEVYAHPTGPATNDGAPESSLQLVDEVGVRVPYRLCSPQPKPNQCNHDRDRKGSPSPAEPSYLDKCRRQHYRDTDAKQGYPSDLAESQLRGPVHRCALRAGGNPPAMKVVSGE